MAIIYTYPLKSSPVDSDLLLISDSADENKTKRVTVDSIRGATTSGVSQIIAGTNITISPVTGTGIVTINSSGGGTPGGSDTQIQYNNGGSFGGTTGLTWDDSTNILSIATRYEGDIDGAVLQQVIVKEPGGVSKGDVVYISGGLGDNPEVRKAQANSASTMAALGIMKDNTAEDDVGECVTSGEITGIDLSGFATGDELFVSNTTAGGLLTSAPTGEANLIQKIGKVIKGGAGGALTVLGAFRTNATPNLNQGSLFIGNGSNQASTLAIGANNTVLTSNGTTASWQAISSSGVIDFTNSNGTFVSFSTTNTNATGSVTIGGVDLSATGTPSASNFLRGDNTWATPTDTNTTYSYNVPIGTTTLRLAESTGTDYDVALVGGTNVTITRNSANQLTFDSPDTNTNLYTTDGTLSGARTVTMSNTLTFSNSSSQQMFQWNPTTNTYKVGNSVNGLKGTIRIDGDGGSNRGGVLELEEGGTGNYHVQIKGPDTMSSSYSVTLPDAGPGTNNRILESDSSGTLSWIDTPSGGGGSSKLGFTPLTIYEATRGVASGATGKTIYRQSVVETDCTIDKVDFFVTAVTGLSNVLTVAVYLGNLTTATRVLLGTSSALSTGMNTITFTAPYTFSAGDDIVIYTSQSGSAEENNTIAGNAGLLNNALLSRGDASYDATPATSISPPEASSNEGLALHFYDE